VREPDRRDATRPPDRLDLAVTSAVPHENLTRDEARHRAALLGDVSYDVTLDLTRGDEVFGCETEIEFTCREPGATTFLDCTAAEVIEVELNDERIEPDAIAATRITLEGLADQNTLRVRSDMRYQHEGKGLHFFRDPTDDGVYLHSQFEPFDAHRVYPCFDQPDIKAPFTLTVQAPADWVVVSNGQVSDKPAPGAPGRWAFAPTPPVSPYVTAVVAGDYVGVHDRHGDIALGLYVRRSLAEHLDSDELFELTRQGFDWFEANFGYPYPFGKYDQLFVPEFSAGAMENPGCVTFSESYVFRSRVTEAQRERRAETLLHEMAHMWFGDLVTMRWWDDLWLNESFATFGSMISQVQATRYTNGWVTFLDAEKAWAKYQDQLPTTHPIAADMPDIESVHQNFDGITYAKGASVLRQLVAWVGEDEFLAGCREYFRAHAWSNATLADFLAALEKASGRDLDTWRDAWLTTTGINTLAADYSLDGAGRFTRFVVEQGAADNHPTLRPHRIAIGVYGFDGDRLVRTHRHELDIDGPSTPVQQLSGVDAGALVLVNDDDLTFAKLRLEQRTTTALTRHLASLDDPLARALAWSATWDMVRDAELAASSFVELVIANVASETEVGVLQRMTARATAAAQRYADRAHVAALMRRLTDHARDQLDRAEAGSGHQLVWARHWADCADSDEQLDDIARLLDGDLGFDGLEIDTELRWHLVTCLVRAGHRDDDLVREELGRDDTDLGERHAATARAAMPDSARKQTAWDRLVHEDGLSHTMARQLWGGFQQLSQPELITPFVDRYFDVLPDIWTGRSLDFALEFSSGMYPHACASPELLDQTSAFLDQDITGPLRRVLLEERDTLARTLRARAADG
jgi:aminopeptidase N